jgi:hypothetical protein
MTPCMLVSIKMEVGGSFQSLVLTYQTVLRHSTEDSILIEIVVFLGPSGQNSE